MNPKDSKHTVCAHVCANLPKQPLCFPVSKHGHTSMQFYSARKNKTKCETVRNTARKLEAGVYFSQIKENSVFVWKLRPAGGGRHGAPAALLDRVSDSGNPDGRSCITETVERFQPLRNVRPRLRKLLCPRVSGPCTAAGVTGA